MRTFLPLSTLAGLRMITIRCSRCERMGRVSVARLLRDHGPDAAASVMWEGLNAGCPKRTSPGTDQCDLHCPELAEVALGQRGVV